MYNRENHTQPSDPAMEAIVRRERPSGEPEQWVIASCEDPGQRKLCDSHQAGTVSDIS
jgi:hypothetical protein